MSNIFEDAHVAPAQNPEELLLQWNCTLLNYLPKNSIALPRELANALLEFRNDCKHWRAVAVYLADCHAASVEEALRLRSKSARSRFAGIMRKAANLLRKEETLPRHIYIGERNELERVVERLRTNAKAIEETL